MRRGMVVILCGLLLLTTAVQTAPAVTVTVWLPGFAAHRDAVIRSFRAEYPRINLNLVCQPAESYAELLTVAAAQRAAPDVFLAEAGVLGPIIDAGGCAPLDPYLMQLADLLAIHPLFLRRVTQAGRTMALPVSGYPLALYVRRDWLDRLGLEPPATWEELALVAEEFTKRDPDGDRRKNTYGLAERWPADDPATAVRFLPWLYQAGGVVAFESDGQWTPGFGSASGIKAARFLRIRLWEPGFIAPGAPTNTAAQALAAFTSGRAGMLFENHLLVPEIRKALGSKVITVPPPIDIRMSTVGELFCFALSNGARHPDEAFTFIRWWLSATMQKRLILGWDDKPGGTGANAGVLILGPRRDIDPAVLLREPLYAGFVRGFPYLSPEPYCPRYDELRSILAQTVAAAMGSAQTAEQAMQAGMDAAAALLRDEQPPQ